MLLPVLAFVSALNWGSAPNLVDSAAVKASLIAADQALADLAMENGAYAFLATLDPSAAVLLPGQPILRGQASRKAFMARYGSPSSYQWRPAHAVASTDGKFGCTLGFSRFTNGVDSVHAEKKGTYLTCWQMGSNGKWHVVGHERNDSPGRSPLMADSSTMPFAPHSATVSLGRSQLRAAQDADAAFARQGSLPEGPGPAFVHYAATDAMMLGGARFPRGLQEIAAAFDGFPADQILKWEPRRSFGAGSGGLAYTVGHSTNGPRDEKSGPSVMQKYMSIWRQNPDGRWVYIFDMGTSR